MTPEVTEQPKTSYFDHERWDVYRVALELIIIVRDIVEAFPRGNAHLADQLQRACISIPLNIAEGAGEYAANEKARVYRIAKRSATECSSILDVCKQLQIISEDQYVRGRGLLLRVVAMLIKMSRCDGSPK